jgi:hypothetical protein
MFVSTRSLRRAGIGAALALALAVPATGVASATPVHSSHATTVSASTKHQAQVTLKKAIAKAVVTYRKAVRTAIVAFNHDPNVILAKANRAAIVGTSTDPGVILAANQAYAGAVSGAVDTRNAAFDSARTARFAAVDAAWAAYDLVVDPANAIARNAYRAAMRSANYELRTHVNAAHRAFRSSTAAAHAQLRASINQAVATYNASGKTPADLVAFKASLASARTVFAHNSAVVAARAARHTAIHNAWVTYAASVRAARVAFHSATGHWPHATRIVLPRI